jgi:hypothetical protein
VGLFLPTVGSQLQGVYFNLGATLALDTIELHKAADLVNALCKAQRATAQEAFRATKRGYCLSNEGTNARETNLAPGMKCTQLQALALLYFPFMLYMKLY